MRISADLVSKDKDLENVLSLLPKENRKVKKSSKLPKKRRKTKKSAKPSKIVSAQKPKASEDDEEIEIVLSDNAKKILKTVGLALLGLLGFFAAKEAFTDNHSDNDKSKDEKKSKPNERKDAKEYSPLLPYDKVRIEIEEAWAKQGYYKTDSIGKLASRATLVVRGWDGEYRIMKGSGAMRIEHTTRNSESKIYHSTNEIEDMGDRQKVEQYIEESED